MVVGDSQWLGAGSTGGHYVDLSEFFDQHNLDEVFVPATVKYYSRVRRQELGDPGRGRRQRLGLPQGLVRGSRPRWPPSRRSTATTSACRRTTRSCATSPSSSTGPTRTATASRSTRRPPMTPWRWASSRRSSPMAATSATTRPARSTASSTRRENVEALELYRELYQFTPPNWGQAFFLENNQAFTEGLVAMTMNYFAFFPALANPATNPHAENTGYFANPPGPTGDAARGARRPGHLDRVLLAEPGGGLQVPRVVHPRGRAEEVGRARRLHLPRRGARVRRSSATRRPTTRPSTSRCRS